MPEKERCDDAFSLARELTNRQLARIRDFRVKMSFCCQNSPGKISALEERGSARIEFHPLRHRQLVGKFSLLGKIKVTYTDYIDCAI